MGAPFKFEELRNQVYNHEIKVFIFGADVTDYLTSSVTITKSDRSGAGTCKFSLSNAMQCFEITDENVTMRDNGTLEAKTFRLYDAHGLYSEVAKAKIFHLKNDSQVLHQTATFGKARLEGIRIYSQKSINASDTQTDTALRYPMAPGMLIFHKYDPVRVFVKNPLNNKDEWTCEFTGYIDTKPYSQNYVNGESIVQVTCQDIRMLLHSMRAQVNPAVAFGNQNALAFGGATTQGVRDAGDAGFFNDLLAPDSIISHSLAGKTFFDAVTSLLLGYAKQGNSVGSVGFLEKGETLTFNVGANDKVKRDVLESWNNLVLFGSDRRFLTEQEVNFIGQNTYHGGSASPDIAKIHFLIPDGSQSVASLVQYHVDGNVTAKLEWSSRQELLSQLCKNIDYQFYVTGIGDIVFEFPMYDFFPSDFGPIYHSLYTFNGHCLLDTINDEGGEAISALVVTSDFLNTTGQDKNPSRPGAVQGFEPVQELKRTVFSNILASRIGVHVEHLSIPGITNQDRLAQLALIEFNKRLANFNKMDMDVSYRPFMGLNRPIFNFVKKRLGIVESISITWTIRGDVSLSMPLSYVRRQEADGKFRFITGGESVPISYSKIYNKAYNQKQGQNVSGPGEGEGGEGRPKPSTGANR